jgi:hypothetical protein
LELSVSDTKAAALKEALDGMFHNHGLSMYKLREQRYDGASNIKSQFLGCIVENSPFSIGNPSRRKSGNWYMLFL